MSYVPATVNFTGSVNKIRQGADYVVVLQVTDSLGNPIDLDALGFTIVRGQFRTNKIKTAGGVTTNCPQPVLTFIDNGESGEIQLRIRHQDTDQSDNPNLELAGYHDIEIEAPNYFGASDPRIERVAEGQWEIDTEVTDADVVP